MTHKRSEAVARGSSFRQQTKGAVPRRLLPILVVDDDIAVRRSLEWLLEGMGFRVVTAADGAEALGKLRKGLAPCLIVLDLAMQGMDGFEFRKAQMRD